MNALISKLKEVLFAVLPITVIVLILNFTLTPVGLPMLIRFLIGALLIIIGLSVFLLGVDIGITPIGRLLGATITKSNKIAIVVIAGLVAGFFISVAEPDLHILAAQVDTVTSGQIAKTLIVTVVSIGLAILMSFGLIRIVYDIPMHLVFAAMYFIVLILSFFISPVFLAISFDASGATTGALTVPFILALAMGVSRLKKDSRASEKDSFGLVGISSAGVVLAVMVMNLFMGTEKITGHLEIAHSENGSIIRPFLDKFPTVAGEIFIALLPMILIFLILSRIPPKISRRTFRKIVTGLVFVFFGLVVFLTGVNAGFMEVGSAVGAKLALSENKNYIVIVGFILGIVTILAEPAVYVLTHQIEDVTSGYVKRRVVLLSLSIGVGFAVALSMIRILVPSIQLWHYLVPGLVISVALSFVVPELFVGMAYDSGGVASGPMTASFILAFAQGAAQAVEGANVLVDGFGVIAMVAITPIIALQVLGFVYKVKSKKRGLVKHGKSE